MISKSEQQSSALLKEGIESYGKALAALSEFRRVVLATYRDVMRTDCAAISAAMQVNLPFEQCLDRIRPGSMSADTDGTYASVGVTFRPEGQGWRQYYHLYWNGDVVGASASIWLKNDSLSQKALEALAKHSPAYPLEIEEKEVYLSHRLDSGNVGNLSKTLHDLNTEWARLWKQVGGLPSIKKAAGLLA